MLKISLSGFQRFLESIFPERETFIREIVQNSMEALHAIDTSNHSSSGLRIEIDVDPINSKIVFRDNGCGMEPEKMERLLGTVFDSGWGEYSSDKLGVGQFGFGFFSTVLVSDRVEVRTRAAGTDAKTTYWTLDVKKGERLPEISRHSLDEHGFEVTLHLADSFRYMASSEYLREHIERYLLFCPYRIFLSGVLLPIQTRAQWLRSLEDSRSASGLVEDIQKIFEWDKEPIAVQCSRDGILAATPSDENVTPATRIYRHGIFVLETEIVPEPLNHIFCGVFNVDDLTIRPDRKSYMDNATAAAFQRRIVEQAGMLFRELSKQPAKAIAFFEGWLDPMIASVLQHDQLADLRIDMPMRLITPRGIALALETSWRHVSANLSEDRIVFTQDPIADKAMIRSLMGGSDVIAFLGNSREVALARHCAKETGTRLVPIAECYLESRKREAVDHQGIRSLFGAPPSSHDCQIICVRDDDSAVPVQLMADGEGTPDILAFLAGFRDALKGGELPDPQTLREANKPGWIAIVNLSHPAIAAILDGLQAGQSRAHLRTSAEVLLLSARIIAEASDNDEDQIALAHSLGELIRLALNSHHSEP